MRDQTTMTPEPRPSRRRFWPGVLTGLAIAAVLGALLPVSGIISMEATGRMSPIDYIGRAMWESSAYWRAPDVENPLADAAAAVSKGFDQYKAMCVHCHGAPNVDRAPWARGLFPLPPDLSRPRTQERSDGKLFYIVKEGIRTTGMPAFGGDHGDEELWQLVAFLRSMDQLTLEQEEQLKQSVGSDHHGHTEQREAAPSNSDHHSAASRPAHQPIK